MIFDPGTNGPANQEEFFPWFLGASHHAAETPPNDPGGSVHAMMNVAKCILLMQPFYVLSMVTVVDHDLPLFMVANLCSKIHGCHDYDSPFHNLCYPFLHTQNPFVELTRALQCIDRPNCSHDSQLFREHEPQQPRKDRHVQGTGSLKNEYTAI